MASYKPVAVQTYPVIQDTLYWNNCKTPVQIEEFGTVSKVDFSPQPPYNYAVTVSSRTHIYGQYSQEPIKIFSHFKDTAYCATFQQDGQLLVAGSEDGRVQLFDISGRAPLRQFEGQTKAVHTIDFTADKYHVVSGADDYAVKLWDIPNANEILTFKEHSDYVRCGCASKLNPDLFVTGSYDHIVKMFDARTSKNVLCVKHGQSVESVLLFPSGGLLVSSGGRYVKFWDMFKRGQLLVSLKNHHRDCDIVLQSRAQLRLHSFHLNLALAHEDETIVVGMTNGILSVKHQKSGAKKDSLPRRRQPAYRTFIKGKNYMKQRDDILINRPTKKALEPNCVIKTPEVTVSIIKELNRRGVLANALAGRDEKEITRVLNFLIRNLSQPRFAPVLINAAEIIIDIYLPVIGQSPVVDKKFLINYQRELLETLGTMDMLFASMTRNESTCVLEHTPVDFLESKKIDS
uniref:U3 small nucleolar RNA-associated protein 15 homolog n=1 Tax=Jaculus jaculus TaxID=51337 RepID=A0A8C5JYW2_JACJA